MRKQGEPEVFRITGARTGLTEDVRARQRRYIISMSIRTVSVVLTVVLWNVERPLAWVMLVVGAVLPYVAVVFANGGRENGSPAIPTVVVPPPDRPVLEATTVEPASERASERASKHNAQYAEGAHRTADPRPTDGAGSENPADSGSANASATEAAERPAPETDPVTDRSDAG